MAQRYEVVGLVMLVALALLPPGLAIMALLDRLRSRFTGARRRVWLPRLAVAANLLLAVCLIDGWMIEPRMVTVTRISDTSSKIAPDTGELTIIHISDIHFERHTAFTERLLSDIEAQKPDLILLTGDVPQLGRFDRRELYEFLGRLGKIARVYAVPGYYEDETVIDESPISDGVLLRSESAEVEVRGTRLVIQGFGPSDHIRPESRPQTGNALYLVLDHTPDTIPLAARLRPDWFFCGHTHGGQVRLPFWGAIITASDTGKRFEYGRYRVGRTQAFVTRGIGLEPRPAPQVRFLCPPEIVVLRISSPR